MKNDAADVPEPYLTAHKDSSLHRDRVLASHWVGCFYCLLIFSPKSIRKWVDDEQTALCPVCGIDAVVPVSVERFNTDFLERMHRYWFSTEK